MQPISYGCFYYVLKNNPLYKVLPIVTMGIPLTGLLAAIFILRGRTNQRIIYWWSYYSSWSGYDSIW